MGGNYGTWIYLAVLFVIMYFLMIRPQQKQNKTRQQMLNNLKKNDRIVTAGGIHGRITSLKEDTVNLEIAQNVIVTLQKSGIAIVDNENVEDPKKGAKALAVEEEQEEVQTEDQAE